MLSLIYCRYPAQQYYFVYPFQKSFTSLFFECFFILCRRRMKHRWISQQVPPRHRLLLMSLPASATTKLFLLFGKARFVTCTPHQYHHSSTHQRQCYFNKTLTRVPTLHYLHSTTHADFTQGARRLTSRSSTAPLLCSAQWRRLGRARWPP